MGKCVLRREVNQKDTLRGGKESVKSLHVNV
jgi:hypothetical protein